MKSINFSTGIKQYAVNGDSNNVISININDLNLLKRIQDAQNIFDPILSKLDTEQNTPELIASVDKEIKDTFDYIFGTDISEHVFGGVNCLSPLEDGNLLFMSFFEAFAPVILEDINKNKAHYEENKSAKFEKYMPQKTEKPVETAPAIELSSLTPEQLAFLESLKK